MSHPTLRRLIVTLASLLGVSGYAPALAHDAQAIEPERYYEALNPMPEGFQVFAGFVIAEQGANGRRQIVSRTSGTPATLFRFAASRILNNRLTFTTQAWKGHHYAFDGCFVRTPPFDAIADQNVPVISGELTKYQDNQPIAQTTLEFKCITADGDD